MGAALYGASRVVGWPSRHDGGALEAPRRVTLLIDPRAKAIVKAANPAPATDESWLGLLHAGW
jgi:hypothetical protein